MSGRFCTTITVHNPHATDRQDIVEALDAYAKDELGDLLEAHGF